MSKPANTAPTITYLVSVTLPDVTAQEVDLSPGSVGFELAVELLAEAVNRFAIKDDGKAKIIVSAPGLSLSYEG